MDKVLTIHVVTVCLTFLATIAMFSGHTEIAGVAVGALAGWIGGNKNGKRNSNTS